MTEKKDTTRNPAADTLADATITVAEKGSADATLSERTEELLVGGMKILQSEKYYRFTSDSVLLSRFARCKAGEVAADFCAGSGIVGLHFYALHQGMVACVTCFEMQKELADMNRRSVALNGLEEKFSVENCRVQDIPAAYVERFSLILCNPPYEKGGLTSPDPAKAACRKEIFLSLEELCAAAARCLRFGGRFALCHRADRLAEALYRLHEAGLEPKRLQLVAGKSGAKPYLALVEAVKGGKAGLTVLPTAENSPPYGDGRKA